MKRKIAGILMIFFIMLNIPVYADSKPYKAALLIELHSGRVLFDYNSSDVLPPASITKLMTYYVLRDFIESHQISFNTTVTVSNDLELGGDISSGANLKPGDKVTLEELINTMLIASANDSAVVLQHYYEDINSSIVDAMNAKAEEIGMNNSKFVNVTGLTEDNGDCNLTTVNDTYILANKLIQDYPDVLKITSKTSYNYNGKKLYSTNKLMDILKKVDGLKTGHTTKAGYCLTATEDLTDINGNGEPFRLLSIVFGCKTEEARITESKKLLEYGSMNFKYNKVVKKEETFRFDNDYYKGGYIEGNVDKDIFMLSSKEDSISITPEINKKLPYNIKKGYKIATLEIHNNGDNKIITENIYASKEFKSVPFYKRVYLVIRDIVNNLKK